MDKTFATEKRLYEKSSAKLDLNMVIFCHPPIHLTRDVHKQSKLLNDAPHLATSLLTKAYTAIKALPQE